MKKDCKDCKHFREYGTIYPPLCSTAKVDYPMNFAKIQRDDNWLLARVLGTCGKSGRFFERKK